MALTFPSNRNDYLGTLRFTVEGSSIDLHLPSSLQVGDKVEFDNVGVGAFLGGVADRLGDGIQFSDFEGTFDQYFGDVGTKSKSALLVQKAVSIFGDTAVAAARDATKTTPNPNTRAVFKQVSLRSFQFTFKLIPNNEGEAENIRDIIKEFRTNMYPKDDAGVAYIFPPTFDIQAFYKEQELDIKMQPCYLESLMTNYNPSSQAFMMKGNGKAHFSEIDLSLTFMEAKTLRKKDIEDGF